MNSVEELNQIVAELPLVAVSEIEVLPIIDMEEALGQVKKAMMAMAKK